jgi:hypothetical protein
MNDTCTAAADLSISDQEQRMAYARRHTAGSPGGRAFAALRDADRRVVGVLAPDAMGCIAVLVVDNEGQVTRLVSDEFGSLWITDGGPLDLGSCDLRTASSRVARQLAGL